MDGFDPVAQNAAAQPARWSIMSDMVDLTAERDRLRFLTRATEVLLSSLDYDKTLQNFSDLAVPALGDWCAVDMLDEHDQLARAAVSHTDAAKVKLAHELWKTHPPKPTDLSGVFHVLRTGEPEMLSEIPESMIDAATQDPAHRQLLRDLGLRSYVVYPLRAHDKVVGALTLVYAESGRRYSQESLELIADFARVASLGVENARLFRAEREAKLRAEALVRAVEKQTLDVKATLLELRAAKEAAERRVAELEGTGRR